MRLIVCAVAAGALMGLGACATNNDDMAAADTGVTSDAAATAPASEPAPMPEPAAPSADTSASDATTTTTTPAPTAGERG